MNISNKFSSWAIWLIAVILVSIAATYAYGKIREGEIIKAELLGHKEPTVYGADGKKNGEPLAIEPTQISHEYIFFEDRVVKRFFYSSEDIAYSVTALNTTFDWVPDGVNKYLIIAPSRIAYEEQTTTNDNEHLAKAIGEISGGIANDVNQVYILETLRQKTNEYIYFRTDDGWTALGAYYAAKEFLSSVDTDSIAIEEYREYISGGHFGVYVLLEDADIWGYSDSVYYYMLEDASNSQMLTAITDQGLNEYRCPTISLSRGGDDRFIGGYFSHSIVDGDGTGKSIMIIGDKYSKIFAPWLIPYYEKILLINPAYYKGDKYILEEMIKEYNVEDFLVIQSVRMFGETVESIRMTRIFETEE